MRFLMESRKIASTCRLHDRGWWSEVQVQQLLLFCSVARENPNPEPRTQQRHPLNMMVLSMLLVSWNILLIPGSLNRCLALCFLRGRSQQDNYELRNGEHAHDLY
jgi:hypothetical protein